MTPEKLIDLMKDPAVTEQIIELLKSQPIKNQIVELSREPIVSERIGEMLRDPAIWDLLAPYIEKAAWMMAIPMALSAMTLAGVVYIAVGLRKLNDRP